MIALDRQLIRLRFLALLIPVALLFWLPSRSLPLTLALTSLMAAYNGAALLASRRRETRPGSWLAVLLLALDHLVFSGWILLFASETASMPYLLYALVAAEAVFRFDLWGGIATSVFFTSGIILFQTGDLGFAISVRDAALRAIPTVAAITGLGAAVRATNTEVRGTRRRLHRTEQLRRVLGELVGQLDMGRMLYTVLRCGMEMLQMDSGAVVLQDDERGIFMLRAVVHMPGAVEGDAVPAGDGIVGPVVRERGFVMATEAPLFGLPGSNGADYGQRFGTPPLPAIGCVGDGIADQVRAELAKPIGIPQPFKPLRRFQDERMATRRRLLLLDDRTHEPDQIARGDLDRELPGADACRVAQVRDQPPHPVRRVRDCVQRALLVCGPAVAAPPGEQLSIPLNARQRLPQIV